METDLFGHPLNLANPQPVDRDNRCISKKRKATAAEFWVCWQLSEMGYAVRHVDCGTDLIVSTADRNFTVEVKATQVLTELKFNRGCVAKFSLLTGKGTQRKNAKPRMTKRSDAYVFVAYHLHAAVVCGPEVADMQTVTIPLEQMMPMRKFEESAVRVFGRPTYEPDANEAESA